MGRLFIEFLESPSNKGVYACKKCALGGETVHLARLDDILSKARGYGATPAGCAVFFSAFRDLPLVLVERRTATSDLCPIDPCSRFTLDLARRTYSTNA